jgi:two-component system sensor histidine kinase/response regulator
MSKSIEFKGELFGKLIKAAPSAMIMVDREGTIVLANLQTENLFGYAEMELIGKPVELLVPGRFRENHPGQRNSFFASPQTRSMGAGRDLFGRRKDGTEVSIEIGLNPIETGEGLFVLASIVDITERKRAEERFRMAVEAAPNAMIMVDREGRIVLANLQTETMFGYARAELIGRQIEMLVPDRFRANHPGQRGSFFTNPRTRSMGAGRDLFGKRKDGSEVSIEIGLNPLETSEGIYVLASIIDITERKKAEILLASQEAALEASRMKSQFLANMSHEIRTPMNGIIGMTELLLNTQLNTRQADYAETIRRSAESLLTIINDILDFSKIEAGKLDLEFAEFDMNELFRDTEQVFSILAEKKEIRLIFSKPSFPKRFKGDSGRIRQVLNNLIGNAIKFTDQGEVSIGITVLEETKEAARLRFEVKDSGIGIPEESLAHLFQMFSQADSTTTRKFGGTGLGLSISKRLVELMGGKIDVKSAPGSGSVFGFELRLELGTSVRTQPKELEQPVPAPAPAMNSHRVLVAEDHLINQKLIHAMLSQLGYTVEVVTNGREALDLLEKSSFDAIVMDCQMPEMDGFEATRVIRAQDDPKLKAIPIIAMTASAIKGDKEKCLEVGMTDYLSKPIHLSNLKAMLEKWLQSRAQ